MSQNQNQFAQTAEKGQMDLRFNSNIISGKIDVTELATLIPGQAVKLVDNSERVPSVIACALDADDVFGFLLYDIKKSEMVAGDRVEIAAMRDNVMYMEASAAIAKGAEVAIVVASKKVVTAVFGDRIIGRAFDKASGDGVLVRVIIDLPGALKA